MWRRLDELKSFQKGHVYQLSGLDSIYSVHNSQARQWQVRGLWLFELRTIRPWLCVKADNVRKVQFIQLATFIDCEHCTLSSA